MAPWLLLAVGVIGIACTANAIRPARPLVLSVPSFFAAWLTGELAAYCLAGQVVTVVVFIAFGALSGVAGWVGLAVSAASWAGLIWIMVVARRSATAPARALADAIGTDHPNRSDHTDHLDGPNPGARGKVGRGRRQLMFPFWLREPGVERIRNLRYAPDARRRHLLDVYRSRRGTERAPVLLQIHGGGWVIGTKGQQGLPIMNEFAAAGWVCVAPNYRLSPKATFPDHLIDCKRALAWIRDNIADYGGDPDFVVVTGGSAGGHLAALMGLTANDPEYQPGFESVDTTVSGCVPFYGVYDLVDMFTDADGRPVGQLLARWLMPTSITEDRAAYERASPRYRLRADAPPFFVIHGDNDNIVPVEQARRFVAALRSVSDNPVGYAELAGASHAFDVFHSVRTNQAVDAAHQFADWCHSGDAVTSPISAAAGATGDLATGDLATGDLATGD